VGLVWIKNPKHAKARDMLKSVHSATHILPITGYTNARMTASRISAAVGIIVAFGAASFGARLHGKWAAARARRRGPHVTHKVEAVQLSRDELLKSMPKEQAINLVQNILRTLEESSNAPDIPATKIRMEKLLEDLKRS